MKNSKDTEAIHPSIGAEEHSPAPISLMAALTEHGRSRELQALEFFRAW